MKIIVEKNFFCGLLCVAVVFLFSCNHCLTKETAYEFTNGNKIIYDRNLFGDATVYYETADEEKVVLFGYFWSDDNERIYDDGVKGSNDSTVVAVLISESTCTKRYPLGTGLRIYKMDLSSGVSISDSETITDKKVAAISSVTDDSVTYVLADGTSVTKEFN